MIINSFMKIVLVKISSVISQADRLLIIVFFLPSETVHLSYGCKFYLPALMTGICIIFLLCI